MCVCMYDTRKKSDSKAIRVLSPTVIGSLLYFITSERFCSPQAHLTNVAHIGCSVGGAKAAEREDNHSFISNAEV